MGFKTSKVKVYGYRAMMGIQFGVTIMLTIFGLFGLIRPPTSVIGVVVLFATAFAISRSDFAKKVNLILQFCSERRCDFDDYPTTDLKRDELRESENLFLDLIRGGGAVINARQKLEKRLSMKDLQGERAAMVQYYNARKALKERWNFYRGVGILPFKDPRHRTEWMDEEEFLKSIFLN